MAKSKNHPGFNEHPAVQKGEGHGRPARGHEGIDRGMYGGNGSGGKQRTPTPAPAPAIGEEC
jgi:hypothetical protein